MVSRRPVAALAAFVLCVPLGALAAPQPQALAPVIERPNWAVGFHWTYHFEGSTDQSFAGFHADSISDTYTAEVVSEATTAFGDAWVIRNTHNGSMSGTGPTGSATGTFTSLTFYYVRKADLAVINFTQDFDATATTIFGPVNGKAHNESVANPPLQEIAWGTPANGAPWHVLSNITSTGWVEIGSFGRVNTSSFLLLDFTLAVNNTQSTTVPAGSFETYNITGGGTANDNGNVYNFTEDFLFGPAVQSKVIDEAGYQLMSSYVNRPPAPSQPLPVVRVEAGASNSSLNLRAYFADPEGDSFTLSCSPVLGLNCSVAPNGTLTVTADPGVNATLVLPVGADDGFPGGNATYGLTVLVRGPGNPNQPPTLVGSATITTTEDTPLSFAFADRFSDPDDATLTYDVELGSGLAFLTNTALGFSAFTAANFNGQLYFTVFAFDSAGNDLTVNFTLNVTPVNDPPVLASTMYARLYAHLGQGTMAVASDASDVDGDAVTVTWYIDGDAAGVGEDTSVTFGGATPGNHSLTATARDSSGGTAMLSFDLTLFGGPSIAGQSPPHNLHIAAGSRIIFVVNATDPDSASLDYRWTLGGSVVAQAINRTQILQEFPDDGTFTVEVIVSDNGSGARANWSVVVESAPAGLVDLLEPANGTAYDPDATIAATASIDPRLSQLSIQWRLNGTPFATTASATVPKISVPGSYVIELAVTGLYNATVPFTTTLNVTVAVRSPAVNNTTNGTGSNNPLPPPELTDITPFLLLLVLAAVAGGAVLYFVAKRRRSPPIA